MQSVQPSRSNPPPHTRLVDSCLPQLLNVHYAVLPTREFPDAAVTCGA
jgi:hypothetical protein